MIDPEQARVLEAYAAAYANSCDAAQELADWLQKFGEHDIRIEQYTASGDKIPTAVINKLKVAINLRWQEIVRDISRQSNADAITAGNKLDEMLGKLNDQKD
mgnify:FL=1